MTARNVPSAGHGNNTVAETSDGTGCFDQWAVNLKNPRRKTKTPSTTAAPVAPLPKLGLGMRVRLDENVTIGKFPTDVDHVVIGIDGNTYNIVPLGGFGDGHEYARVVRGHLSLVEEPSN